MGSAGSTTDLDPRIVEPARLAVWLGNAGVPGGVLENLRLLAGGTQNLLVQFSRGGMDYVLRRPSLTPRPEAEKTLRREARVLGALAHTGVPHPRLVAFCEDPGIIGSIFYVMERKEGFNPALGLPPPFDTDPAARHRLGLSLIDGIAALSRVDPHAVGLDDFGKLDGFLERQVPRWASQLESYAKFAKWPGPEGLGDVKAVGDWLNANMPAAMQPGLIHGDYHLGNVICAADGSLSAIVDWELSTLGDPMLDLARLTAAWPDADGTGPLSLTVKPWTGFPTRDELAARYGELTGRPMHDLLWFEVLACYKLGIILEGTYARASEGLAPAETGERLHKSARALFDRARKWIAEKG